MRVNSLILPWHVYNTHIILSSYIYIPVASICVEPNNSWPTGFCRAMLCISRLLPACGVRLSRSWVAPKRLKISSKFFHHRVAKQFKFFLTKRGGAIPTGTPLTGASNAPPATVDNTWLVAALTAGTKARYRLRIAISAYPTTLSLFIFGLQPG